eukprot:TRINITY_DN3894_c0_g1_i1.p1 TRINITY_DN3894_c0_g1~~TRINITY_DN3894_c0_g1_i1.p1  ORF type:complete len:329 (+),score=29.75 TRINITY_DN3894_c0_g1_i1:67-987(+)
MMKSVLFLCAVAPCLQVAGAVDCSTIVVTQGMRCESGNSLISEADATTCQAALCTMLSSQYTWAKLQISSTNQAFVGPGYAATCGLLPWDGLTLGESLCAPPSPSPYPTPTAPTFNCWKLSVASGSCPDGLALATPDVVFGCVAELCSRLDTWQMVGYASPNMAFVGSGYDATCGVQSYYGTPGDVICAAPGAAPPQAADCSQLWISPGSCPDGLALATPEIVAACQGQLCATLGSSEKVMYAAPNMAVVGNSYSSTCGTQSYSSPSLSGTYSGPSEKVLCMSGAGTDGGLAAGGVLLVIFCSLMQ